jgi:hypothetical protein
LSPETATYFLAQAKQDGRDFGAPRRLERPDFEANGPAGHLDIEVTRAVVGGSFWKDLATTQRAETPAGGKQAAADDMWQAINSKWQKIHDQVQRGMYPVALESVVLLVNAIRTPGHALAPVVEEFRGRYGLLTRNLRFREVWVVGPSDAFVKRLDQAL